MSVKNPNIVINTLGLYPETKQLKKKGDDDLPVVKVLDVYENLDFLLSRFKAIVRHNQMTRKREIIMPGHFTFEDDVENDSLSRIENIAALNGMPNRQIDKWLDILAGENAYHPVVRCINANVWDGVKRLDDFINTIESTNPDIDKLVIRTWMTAAIAAAFSKTGFTNHGVLVLQGAQGLGKTAWVKTLDPDDLGAIVTGVLLDPKNKDTVIGANRFWIVELGELDATTNKTDIAHLKSHITNSVDNIRVPYGRRESKLIRRTAYVATVNDHSFLVDTTGNRRWWTVATTRINYEHNMNMKQVWAEVYHEWINGAKTYLPSELQNLVNEKNKDHEKIDPLKELLVTNYDWTSSTRREITSTDVLIELDFKKPSPTECNRMSKLIQEMTGNAPRRTKNARLHLMPYKVSYFNHV